MSDWQVGDLAVCVDVAPFQVPNGRMTFGFGLEVGQSYHVVSIYRHPCGELALHLNPATHEHGSAARRFRKIRPDEHEACEPEFVTLLKRTKRTVSA